MVGTLHTAGELKLRFTEARQAADVVVSTAQALPNGTIHTTAEPVELEIRASFSAGTWYLRKNGLPTRAVTAMELVPSTKSSSPSTKEISWAATGDFIICRIGENIGNGLQPANEIPCIGSDDNRGC